MVMEEQNLLPVHLGAIAEAPAPPPLAANLLVQGGSFTANHFGGNGIHILATEDVSQNASINSAISIGLAPGRYHHNHHHHVVSPLSSMAGIAPPTMMDDSSNSIAINGNRGVSYMNEESNMAKSHASITNSSSNNACNVNNNNASNGNNNNASNDNSYNGNGSGNNNLNNNNNNNNCSSGSRKRSRSAPWTVPEMLTLIDAKRSERQRSLSFKTRGLKLPGAEKWKLVSRYLESKDIERSGSQCQDKWENMMKDYKAVRDWQCNINGASARSDHRNYFKDMTNKERKEARLPPQMDEIIFYSLHTVQNEKEEQRRRAHQGQKGLTKPIEPNLSLLIASHDNANEGISLVSPTNHGVKEDTYEPAVMGDQEMQINGGSRGAPGGPSLHMNHNNNKGEAAACDKYPFKESTATLVQVLVALADAVKTVAQKL